MTESHKTKLGTVTMITLRSMYSVYSEINGIICIYKTTSSTKAGSYYKSLVKELNNDCHQTKKSI